jgi:transposase-like protein
MAAARVFTVEFRVAVAERILNGENVSALSNELKIKRSALYRWRDWYREQGISGLSRRKGRPPRNPAIAVPQPSVHTAAADQRMAELERRLGRSGLAEASPSFFAIRISPAIKNAALDLVLTAQRRHTLTI